MGNDDPFGDLGEAIEEQEADDSDSDTTASTGDSSTSRSTSDTSTTTGSGSSDVDQDDTGENETEADPFTTPGFSFGEEAKQYPFYVREETLEEWEDVDDVEVTPALVKAGVKSVQKSEKHDAILRLAMDHPELVAEYVKDGRGIDADLSRDDG